MYDMRFCTHQFAQSPGFIICTNYACSVKWSEHNALVEKAWEDAVQGLGNALNKTRGKCVQLVTGSAGKIIRASYLLYCSRIKMLR